MSNCEKCAETMRQCEERLESRERIHAFFDKQGHRQTLWVFNVTAVACFVTGLAVGLMT